MSADPQGFLHTTTRNLSQVLSMSTIVARKEAWLEGGTAPADRETFWSMVVTGTVLMPGIVVAMGGGYISADTELELRSYPRLEWLLA